jgi:hypothetical protein
MALYSPRKLTIAGGSGGTEGARPWDLTVSQSGGVTTVRVAPGTINNIVPSNMFENILAGTASTLFVKLACSTDGMVITDVFIYINSNPSAAQTAVDSALPAYFEFTVGVINEGTGYNTAQRLLTAVGSRLFIADKPTPAQPGELAFREWLVWAVRT